MSVMRAKYEQLGSKPGFVELRANTPVLATWDDHDYGVNDGGAEYPMKEGAKQEFMDFFEVPDDAPMRTREGIYAAHTFGDERHRVQVLLLDTRSFRGPLDPGEPPARYGPTDDTSRTVLGEQQWSWLEQQLREPARIRIIASSIQVIPEQHGWEKWGNFPHERQRFFELLRRTAAEGVILLSGDRHLAEISFLPADDALGIGYPLYEVTSSGLNRGGGGNADEPNRYRIGPGNFRGDNFGAITIDWSGDDPSLGLRVYDADGETALQTDVALSRLRAPG